MVGLTDILVGVFLSCFKFAEPLVGEGGVSWLFFLIEDSWLGSLGALGDPSLNETFVQMKYLFSEWLRCTELPEASLSGLYAVQS